jgi:hypothetical protein
MQSGVDSGGPLIRTQPFIQEEIAFLGRRTVLHLSFGTLRVMGCYVRTPLKEELGGQGRKAVGKSERKALTWIGPSVSVRVW